MDGHAAFLYIDLYQQGQGCDHICAAAAYDELKALNLTSGGSAEIFVNKWDKIITKIKELDKPVRIVCPTDFIQQAMFRDAIRDTDYDGVMAHLNIILPPPEIEQCKQELMKLWR